MGWAAIAAIACLGPGCAGAMPHPKKFEAIERTAGEGESEIIVKTIESSGSYKVKIFIDGQERLRLKDGLGGTIIVPDGMHSIHAVGTPPINRLVFVGLVASPAMALTYGISRSNSFTYTSKTDTVNAASNRTVFEVKNGTPQRRRAIAQSEWGNLNKQISLRKYMEIPLDSLPKSGGAPKKIPRIAPADQSLLKIAVYVTGSAGEGEKKAMGTRMLAALVNSKRYMAVERSEEFLEQLDAEHAKQRGGDVSDSQIKRLGMRYGVDYLCIVDISPVLDGFQVSARVIDVETAVVVFIGEAISPMETISDLESVAVKAVSNMFEEETPAEQTPAEQAVRTKRKRPSEPTWDGRGKKLTGPSAGVAVFVIVGESKGETGGSNEFWYMGGRATTTHTARTREETGGINVFLDMVYAEININYSDARYRSYSDTIYTDYSRYDSVTYQMATMGFGVLGKYPFALGEYFSIFPAAGIEYAMALFGKMRHLTHHSWRPNDSDEYVLDGKDGRSKASDFNTLSFKFGGGFDWGFGERWFMRIVFLYSLNMANKYERDIVKDSDLLHGFSFKFGTGFNF